MEPEWGVIIGLGVGGLLREIWLLYKYNRTDTVEKKDSKTAAIISIVSGCLFPIPFLGVIGIAVGVYALRKTIYKGLAITGIVLNSLSLILWIAITFDAV